MNRFLADPPEDAGLPDAERSAGRSPWLNDARSRVVASLIGAAGVVLVGIIGFYVGSSTGSPPASRSQPPPSISLMAPGPDSHIAHLVAVSGTARNLRAYQMVWIFNEAVLPDGTPSGKFYPELGPCPVRGDGTWTCTGAQVGKPDDYGKRYLIWAAIVTDQQAYNYIKVAVAPPGLNSFNPAGVNAPPHVTGSPGATSTLVTRCAPGQQC